MTREEAIQVLNMVEAHGLADEAKRMAIEALTEPKTIIGIDIPYGSDKGIATVFKGKNDKLILEEVKEIMSVVRCKDCRYFTHYADGCGVCDEKNNILTYQNQNDFCSYGERREE